MYIYIRPRLCNHLRKSLSNSARLRFKYCRYTAAYLFAKASHPKLVPSSNLRRPLLPNMIKPSPEKKTPNSINKTQRHFKGVRMRKWGKWVSEVRVPHSKGKGKIWLGSYDTPQQAARAYDCAVYCLRGSQAKFNFPDSVSKIPSASFFSYSQIQAVAAMFGKGEFRQTLDCNATFCGSESLSGVYSHQSLEEQDLALLDSLLEEVESLQFPIMEDFLPLDDLLDDTDFHKDFCSTGCRE